MALALNSTRRRLATFAAIGVTACGVLAGAMPADAAATYHVRPVVAGSRYLALGDSVAFGFREPANKPYPNYAHAKNFYGYPEKIAAAFKLNTANISCPGETSASLINDKKPSYACETPSGYRTNFPLHVKYSGSQLQYALRYLKAHPNTRLVSLMIGANDGFLCQASTKDHCKSELPSVLKKVKANVATILGKIRKAGYKDQIVIVNYYSTDYSSKASNAQSIALNQAMDAGAKPYHVTIADGYDLFRRAAAQAGGDTCKAGLLTILSTGGCGVHPSVAGQALLASAVEQVVKSA